MYDEISEKTIHLSIGKHLRLLGVIKNEIYKKIL